MYGDDWDEQQSEEMKKQEFLQRMREKALKSYPAGEPHRYCSECGELLAYGSFNYNAGEHIDVC